MKTVRTTVMIFVFLVSIISGVSGETYIGILLDGFEENCSIHSGGEVFPCKERRQLYKGDKIIKLPNIHSLKIKWAPYAKGKELNATTALVTFEPPENKKDVLQTIKEMVGLMRTTHSVVTSAARSGPFEPKVTQPGNRATVMPGETITFVLERAYDKSIVFKDSGGRDVFTKDLKGSSLVQLTPEEIGLKPHEVYKWSMSGQRKSRQFTIRLLSSEISQLVAADLKEIDKEELSEPEKYIKKVTYLQFMSEAYPKEMDLYWLSYQVLREIKNKNNLKEDDKILIKELIDNYLRHLSETE